MTTLLVATANPGKVRELTAALRVAGIEVAPLETLSDRTPIEETGATFEENARIKASEYSRRTPLAVVADDSGLEVDALGGDPGVRSARYGGDGLDDEDRVRLVLARLDGVEAAKRAARFRCVLAVAQRGTVLATFEGVVEGRILEEPRGSNGFGYDPIFFHDGLGRGFAELTLEQKEELSHRGQAIRRMVATLRAGTLRIDG